MEVSEAKFQKIGMVLTSKTHAVLLVIVNSRKLFLALIDELSSLFSVIRT